MRLFTDSHELAEAEALYFTKMGEQSRIAESLSLRLIVEHLKGTVSIPYINKLTSLIECRPAILAQAIGPSAYSQLLNYHDPDELIHALTRSLTNLTPVRPEIISMVARLVADSPQIAQRVSSELSSLLLGDQAQLVLISKHDLKIAYLHQYYQLALKLIEAHDNPQLKTEICSKVVEITDKAQKQHRCCLQVLECLLAATNPGQQRLRAKIRAGLEGFTQSLCATEVQ